MGVYKFEPKMVGNCDECGLHINHFCPITESGKYVCEDCLDENIHGMYVENTWPFEKIKEIC